MFSRLEYGQSMALYDGVVRLHRANAEVARGIVSTHRVERKNFIERYKTVNDHDLPAESAADLKVAEMFATG